MIKAELQYGLFSAAGPPSWGLWIARRGGSASSRRQLRTLRPASARRIAEGQGMALDRQADGSYASVPKDVTLLEPLCDYCSWGIGGPARFFARAANVDSMRRLIKWAVSSAVPVWVLGRGSNTLFDDRGFDGLVIVNELDFLEDLGGGRFRVGSGYQFNRLGLWAAGRGWGGLSFAAGIPGTVGGAAFMNAGSNGQDTAGVAIAAEVLHADGSIETMDLATGSESASQFGYRKSPFQTLPRTSVITAVTFQLWPDPQAPATAHKYLARRKATQPLQDRSAGSVFRNPSTGTPGDVPVPAGKLIEQLGLKGAMQGGAAVSTHHANFFINKAGSTSSDMQHLIQLVKRRVFEETGILLEEEICVVPYSADSAQITIDAVMQIAPDGINLQPTPLNHVATAFVI